MLKTTKVSIKIGLVEYGAMYFGRKVPNILKGLVSHTICHNVPEHCKFQFSSVAVETNTAST